MAKANWVKVDKSSGSNNATVNVSTLTDHTGRKARTSVLTWKGANVEDAPASVIQAGKPEFVDVVDSESSESTGKVVTISGTSNSAKLTFSLGTGTLNVSLPSTYTANSITVANGASISGDPGASAEYPFSIRITVPSNAGTTDLSRQIIVTDEGGHQDVCVLTLAGGEPYIRITPSVIELDYKGTPVAVQVESNTSWSIE